MQLAEELQELAKFKTQARVGSAQVQAWDRGYLQRKAKVWILVCRAHSSSRRSLIFLSRKKCTSLLFCSPAVHTFSIS